MTNLPDGVRSASCFCGMARMRWISNRRQAVPNRYSAKTRSEAVREALLCISLCLPIPPGLLRQALLDLSVLREDSGRDAMLAALFTGVMARGPEETHVLELILAALSLDQPQQSPVHFDGASVIVMAGSGKKAAPTMNVSTPSAVVAVAAGATVVKLGSWATASVTGSRDLVSCLGIREVATATEVFDELDRCRFAFVPIEDRIPRLDNIYGGYFRVPNPLSFALPALLSPIIPDLLVYGLAHPRVDLSARVMAATGVREAVIIASKHGPYYLDEFGVTGSWLISRVHEGSAHETTSLPVDDVITLPPDTRLRTPANSIQSVEWVLDALAGRGNPLHVDLLAVNAAQLLVLGGLASNVHTGYEQAKKIIKDGAALATLSHVTQCAMSSQK